jgi:hypothetical protein
MHRPPQIFFDPQIDVLYFGNREGYLEGFKHFVNTLMIVDPAELGKVERLAVCAEIFSGGEYGRKGAMGGSVTTTSLKDFWEAVRSRFQGVKEVIVVPGIEGRGFPGLGNDDRLEKEGMDDRRDKKENLDAFYWRIVRAVSHVEERWGWVAPVWRVVALPEGERERM